MIINNTVSGPISLLKNLDMIINLYVVKLDIPPILRKQMVLIFLLNTY